MAARTGVRSGLRGAELGTGARIRPLEIASHAQAIAIKRESRAIRGGFRRRKVVPMTTVRVLFSDVAIGRFLILMHAL